MRRVVPLLVLSFFGISRPAVASSSCDLAMALRGPVQSVEVKHGHVDAVTGAPVNVPHLWERWEISRDRRTVTIEQYSDPGPPTTICDYDVSGRLVKSVLYLDGRTVFTDTQYAYDDQGRLVLEQSRSKNPEFTGDTRTEYVQDVVITQARAGNRMAVRTIRDDQGRPVRKTSWDPSDGAERSDVVYHYEPDVTEATGRENGSTWRHRSWKDHMGNTVELTSTMGTFTSKDTFTYEYDSHGNCFRLTSTMSSGATPAPKRASLTLNEIRYYPEPRR